MSELETITSASNSALKRARRLLNSAKARSEESAFVVEGRNGVAMLLSARQTRFEVETVFISNGLLESELGQELRQALDAERIRVVDDKLLTRVQDMRTSQGVMAIARLPGCAPDLESTTGRVLLLDRLADPGNMGTIIRTAVGMGIDRILLFGDCVDVYNPKCVRSTAGMLPYVEIVRVDADNLRRLTAAGFELICAERDAGVAIDAWEPPQDCIVAVGSEAHGIFKDVRALASGFVGIPLAPICESLNAAVAAGMLMLKMSSKPTK